VRKAFSLRVAHFRGELQKHTVIQFQRAEKIISSPIRKPGGSGAAVSRMRIFSAPQQRLRGGVLLHLLDKTIAVLSNISAFAQNAANCLRDCNRGRPGPSNFLLLRSD
jgi:hypothetical protein